MVLLDSPGEVQSTATTIDLFLDEPRGIESGDVPFLVGVVFLFVALCVGAIVLYRRLLRRRPALVVGSVAPCADAPSGDLAVAAFVAANATRVDERSLAAIVLSLADRGALRLHLLPGGGVDVELLGRYEPRSRCERQVLALVGDQATGPRAAFWTDVSSQWWHRFRRAILLDAYQAGLVRHAIGLPPPPEDPVVPWWGWVAGGAVGVAGLAAAVASGAMAFSSLGVPIVVVALGFGIRLFPWELTTEGQALGSRWLAHRRWLAERTDFADVPAAGVTVWGEHLVHAAATGLAPRAVADLRPVVDAHVANAGAARRH